MRGDGHKQLASMLHDMVALNEGEVRFQFSVKLWNDDQLKEFLGNLIHVSDPTRRDWARPQRLHLTPDVSNKLDLKIDPVAGGSFHGVPVSLIPNETNGLGVTLSPK